MKKYQTEVVCKLRLWKDLVENLPSPDIFIADTLKALEDATIEETIKKTWPPYLGFKFFVNVDIYPFKGDAKDYIPLQVRVIITAKPWLLWLGKYIIKE